MRFLLIHHRRFISSMILRKMMRFPSEWIHRFLPSKMFLWVSTCWGFICSIEEISQSNFLKGKKSLIEIFIQSSNSSFPIISYTSIASKWKKNYTKNSHCDISTAKLFHLQLPTNVKFQWDLESLFGAAIITTIIWEFN